MKNYPHDYQLFSSTIHRWINNSNCRYNQRLFFSKVNRQANVCLHGKLHCSKITRLINNRLCSKVGKKEGKRIEIGDTKGSEVMEERARFRVVAWKMIIRQTRWRAAAAICQERIGVVSDCFRLAVSTRTEPTLEKWRVGVRPTSLSTVVSTSRAVIASGSLLRDGSF